MSYFRSHNCLLVASIDPSTATISTEAFSTTSFSTIEANDFISVTENPNSVTEAQEEASQPEILKRESNDVVVQYVGKGRRQVANRSGNSHGT